MPSMLHWLLQRHAPAMQTICHTSSPYTLHPTPYTLHPTPYNLHPYALIPDPCTQHSIVIVSDSMCVVFHILY